jgi:hypothetical protein
MKRAFRSLTPPKGFYVDIIDSEHFLTVRANEKVFMALSGQDKIYAVEYMIKVKKVLEENGAIVLLIREGGVEE